MIKWNSNGLAMLTADQRATLADPAFALGPDGFSVWRTFPDCVRIVGELEIDPEPPAPAPPAPEPEPTPAPEPEPTPAPELEPTPAPELERP